MTALVTKLTEEVDNRYLRRIDEAVYDIKPGVSSTIFEVYNSYVTSSGNTARVVGGGHFEDGAGNNLGSEVPLSISQWTYLRIHGAGGGKVFIRKKYDLQRFVCQPDNATIDVDVDQFACSPKISVFRTSPNAAYGDIRSFSGCTDLTELKLQSSRISGNLDDLRSLTKLKYVDLINAKISGDIASLSKNIEMTSLLLKNASTINFDFDELADGMVENGRTSGTLTTTNTDNTRAVYTFTSNGWTKA